MTYQQSAPALHDPEHDAAEGPRPGKRDRGRRNVGKLLDAAREKVEAKRWKDAASLLKRALSAERDNPVVAARLAFVCLHQNRPADARKLIARALAAGPMVPEVHRLHGVVLHAFRELDASANAFTHALQLKPDYGDAYRDLGVLLYDAGIPRQAMEALVMAVKLNPRDAVAFYHLGLIKKMQRRDDEAMKAYRLAVAIKPDYAEALVNIGKIAIDQKDLVLGEQFCRKAIEADPNLAQSYVNMTMLLRQLSRPEEAVTFGRKAVELDPRNGAALSNLGNAYMDLHRYQEAQACFRKAIEYEPNFAATYFNYGNALRLLYVLDKALEAYDQAIKIQPGSGVFHNNRGLVYKEQGRLDDAVAEFRRAIALAPDLPMLRLSLALSLRRRGLFEESWDYLDTRLEMVPGEPKRNFRKPRWRGEDISDKRILVWREQGIGDEIDFSRRYPDIIAAAGEVIFESDARLVPIFERTFPHVRFLPENIDRDADWERQDCDLHLPAWNLFQYFPFTQEERDMVAYPEDDIEAAFLCGERSKEAKGYLLPDPERVKEMAARVDALPEGLKVGICWRSQMSHRDRDIHYTRLQMWEPIFRVPGLVFVNLFYDQCEEEIKDAEERFGINIHRWPDVDLKNDMEAAFALTTQVDMLITTSTSPQRIAEAVGKEVWLMSTGGRCPMQPPVGEYGVPHQIHWQRHWKEPWPVLMGRMARALEARLRG